MWRAPRGKPAFAAARADLRGGHHHHFNLDATHAEPAGYTYATQTPDGVIHLISSNLHYRFNLKWLQTPPTHLLKNVDQSPSLTRTADP